jgi:magnesium chelatase family protein
VALATVYSRALVGVEALEVRVEVHLSNGLPGFAIVGLPETAVRESKERVRSAIINSGLEFPMRRITVNLAPADLPKSGGKYDLAIALCILQASKQIAKTSLENTEILGELALDGSIRPVHGALAAIVSAAKQGRRLILPAANEEELALVEYIHSASYWALLDVVNALNQRKNVNGANSINHEQDKNQNPNGLAQAGESSGSKLGHAHKLSGLGPSPLRVIVPSFCGEPLGAKIQFPDEIKGQGFAKLAIKIAAAGGHNILLVGPPGCGKTLLANRLLELLPALTSDQAMEVATIRSAAQLDVSASSCTIRPVRSPHHSATAVSMLGGGQKAMPGEISLAHQGVLFLDELTEFKKSVLDSLREPLESGEIYITRANYRVRFPANFQLVAAMNPCPCGYAGDVRRQCRCGEGVAQRYLSKLSGPFLDRFDIVIELQGLSQSELLVQKPIQRNPSLERQTIVDCRDRQNSRAAKLNNQLMASELDSACELSQAQKVNLAQQIEAIGMSSRATHRVLKVARTLADLDCSEPVQTAHLQKALMLRRSSLICQALELD